MEIETNSYMPSNGLPNATLTSGLVFALDALICDRHVPLQHMQARLDAMLASYDSAFQELEQSMVALTRDVRAARLPVHLKTMRRVRNGHTQVYLYWIANGKAHDGRVEPRDYLSDLLLKKYEPLQARYIKLQANHGLLVHARDVLNLMNTTLNNRQGD